MRLPSGLRIRFRGGFGPDSCPVSAARGLATLLCNCFYVIFLKSQQKCKKPVDRIQPPPYMPSHRSGAAGFSGSNAAVANIDWTTGPPVKIGEPLLSASCVWWLFDIVGF